MTTDFKIRLVVDGPSENDDERERVLIESQFNHFPVENFDEVIIKTIEAALSVVGEHKLPSLQPQLVMTLFVDGEQIRATMHLGVSAIKKLADVGASFDFDPYIYE
jgi:hypothetical protein